MTENDTLEVVLLYHSRVFYFIIHSKSFDFNFALNKEVFWSFPKMLDRTLFQSKGLLINTLYVDLWIKYLGNAKLFFDKLVGYLWEG